MLTEIDLLSKRIKDTDKGIKVMLIKIELEWKKLIIGRVGHLRAHGYE